MDKKPPKIVKEINKGNYSKMRQIFKSVDWDNAIKKTKDIDEMWKTFTDTAENECIPTKTVYVNGTKSKRLSMPLDKKTFERLKRKTNCGVMLEKIWQLKNRNFNTTKLEIKLEE